MSYDLMVFEVDKAPKTRTEFLAWYQEQTEWPEAHSYDDCAVTSPALCNWYQEMIGTFPPMNGPDACEDDELEAYWVDYSIGMKIIYAAFPWSKAEEAYDLVRTLAQNHEVGFFDVSGENGDVLLPDGKTVD
jgi:hypothetical protein